MMTRVLHALTDASTSRRGKFVTIALWLLCAVVLTGVAPRLAGLYDNSIQQRVPANDDSQVAQRLLLQAFPSSRGTPAVLVFYDPGGLGVADRIRIKQVSDWLISGQKPAVVSAVLSPFTVPASTPQLISQDGTTLTLITQLSGSATDQATQEGVKKIRQYLQQVTTGGPLQAHLTGPAGVLTDATAVFSSIDITLLLTTIGLVFVLLIVLYRSPILALLPLLAVGVALQ